MFYPIPASFHTGTEPSKLAILAVIVGNVSRKDKRREESSSILAIYTVYIIVCFIRQAGRQASVVLLCVHTSITYVEAAAAAFSLLQPHTV